jgi:hypothetical protein
MIIRPFGKNFPAEQTGRSMPPGINEEKIPVLLPVIFFVKHLFPNARFYPGLIRIETLSNYKFSKSVHVIIGSN